LVAFDATLPALAAVPKPACDCAGRPLPMSIAPAIIWRPVACVLSRAWFAFMAPVAAPATPSWFTSEVDITCEGSTPIEASCAAVLAFCASIWVWLSASACEAA
jgi:hypothetical protein